MNYFLQILILFLTWFTNLNATPVITKVVLPSYEFTFLKIENVKEESVVKIGGQNFARSGIKENILQQTTPHFSSSKQRPSFLKDAVQNFGVLQLEKSLAKSWVASINFSIKEKLSLVEHRARERCEDDVQGAGSLIDELSIAVRNSCNADELAELVQDATSFNLAKTQPQKFIDGKNFERGIGNLIDNGDQTFLNQVANHANVNLSQYTPIKQLQINLPNGGYMIADNAWVKQINVGGQVQFEVILNECKLSSAAPWTTRQTELLNSLNGGNITFTTRSIKEDITRVIPQNSTIKIKTVVKTEGTGSGHTITKVF